MTGRTISTAVRRAFAREERIAHLLGGLLFMAGGLATIALVLVPATTAPTRAWPCSSASRA